MKYVEKINRSEDMVFEGNLSGVSMRATYRSGGDQSKYIFEFDGGGQYQWIKYEANEEGGQGVLVIQGNYEMLELADMFANAAKFAKVNLDEEIRYQQRCQAASRARELQKNNEQK